MSYETTGEIKLINDIQTFSSGFEKREFVITTDEKYQQDVKFELIKDKCSDIDKFNVGDSIKVSFNVRGNEYNSKYFVNLQAWRLAVPMEETNNPIPAPLDPMAAQPQPANVDDIGEDDLPF